MGSITDITDCDGTVLNHYAYDAFGNRTVEEETVENRLGFAGEMLDAVTGQYYLRARFYNPVIARFLSEDTYYGDGLNLYAYCHNNPVRYVDTSGHEGLICSKKYGELKKKEAEGGTLSEKEKRQIYEYEQNQKKSNGAGNDSRSGTDVWDMVEGGGTINGREYSQHAMERMAPDTPQVRAELSRRAEKAATQRGLKVGTQEYYEYCKKYVDPRNIPPSVIEDAISSTKGIPGNRPDTFIHETADVKIVINSAGKVITVIPK